MLTISLFPHGNASSVKIPIGYFKMKLDKLFLKLTWKCKGVLVKTSSMKKNIAGGLIFTDFKKALAPHSSTLAWKIPWMEEPGRLQSMGLLRVGHD